MAANKFKPGDKVICIEDAPDYRCDGKYAIKKDTVLTVRKVGVDQDEDPSCTFEEQVVIINGYSCGHKEKFFAPYREPRERIIYVAETLRDEVTCETKRELQHN